MHREVSPSEGFRANVDVGDLWASKEVDNRRREWNGADWGRWNQIFSRLRDCVTSVFDSAGGADEMCIVYLSHRYGFFPITV